MRHFHRQRLREEIESLFAGLAVFERHAPELFLSAQQGGIVGSIEFTDGNDAVVARVQDIALETELLEHVANFVGHPRSIVEALTGMLAQTYLVQKPTRRRSCLDCVSSPKFLHRQSPLFRTLEEAARLISVERLPKRIDLGDRLALGRKGWIGNHHCRMEGVDGIAL